MPTAAAKLGVANIVTGSIRRGAGTIRVSAELIDGKSGLSRWSQTYDRAAGDALTIESGIAESVANALSIALGRAEKALLTLGGTTNAAAHDAYLRGQALAAKQQTKLSLKEFDAAIAADPDYALARAARANALTVLAGNTLGGAALQAKLTAAEADARRAVALAPGLGAPLASLGYVLAAGRIDEAIATLRQALARLPDVDETRVNLATALIVEGQPVEARRVIAALPDGDILRPTYEAIATARLGDRVASDLALAELVRRYSIECQYQIAEVHAQRGEADAAFAAIDRAWDLADPGLIQLKTDPLLVPLHADPRFAAWLQKIGFP